MYQVRRCSESKEFLWQFCIKIQVSYSRQFSEFIATLVKKAIEDKLKKSKLNQKQVAGEKVVIPRACTRANITIHFDNWSKKQLIIYAMLQYIQYLHHTQACIGSFKRANSLWHAITDRNFEMRMFHTSKQKSFWPQIRFCAFTSACGRQTGWQQGNISCSDSQMTWLLTAQALNISVPGRQKR